MNIYYRDPLKDYELSDWLSRIPHADAIIKAVNLLGTNPREYPSHTCFVIRAIVRNCWWSGMFGETGMKCYRCDNEDCSHRQ